MASLPFLDGSSTVSSADDQPWSDLVAGLAVAPTETAVVAYFDDQNVLRGRLHFSDHQCGAVLLDPPTVLRQALLLRATQLVLIHNHPSGDCRPSAADIRLTRRIVQGCHSIGLTCIDHVIVAADGQFSMRAATLM